MNAAIRAAVITLLVMAAIIVVGVIVKAVYDSRKGLRLSSSRRQMKEARTLPSPVRIRSYHIADKFIIPPDDPFTFVKADNVGHLGNTAVEFVLDLKLNDAVAQIIGSEAVLPPPVPAVGGS